ncbi:MAG TPA: general secretion pathway protein GspG [Methylophilaceae bacterium]|nr:general secretion pathway protein GspG [Methylophilaceae bacterium]
MKRDCGFTLIELVVTVAIVAILASAAVPLLKVSVQRNKEIELRTHLRQLRDAIDAYKKAYDEGRIELKTEGKTGYPPNLTVLVEGIPDKRDPNNKQKLKFLRRIPIDPMSSNNASSESRDASTSWGLRSYDSEAAHPTSGEDVYDVYSLSPLTGSNGIPYAQW